jgi:hypothetical protein
VAPLIEQRLGALTLGVRDLARARRCYEHGLGWTRDGGEDDIYFADPDGHLWQVQWHPHLEITDRGEHLMKRSA